MSETKPESDTFGRAGRVALAAGIFGLGLLGLIYADFALQWQPVPNDLIWRTPIAYTTAAVLAVAGATLLIDRLYRQATWVLAVTLFVWTALLMLPRVVAAPLDVGKWNGFAEIQALAASAFLLAAISPRGALADRIALFCFGVSPLVFGIAHFVYADFTAAFVPAWIPEPLFWAYFTGCAHIAGGLAILSGVLSRLGAIMLGVMYASWVLILHVPRVAAAPTTRIEWTMLAVATSLTGAAWIVAGRLSPRREG